MELLPGIKVRFKEFDYKEKKFSDYEKEGAFLAVGIQCEEHSSSSSFILRMSDGTIRNIFAENCKID